MSPGSGTERLAFFVAESASHDRVSAGDGLESNGEGSNPQPLRLPRFPSTSRRRRPWMPAVITVVCSSIERILSRLGST